MKMKQIFNKLFLFGILGSFVLLYSCGDDDTEDINNTPTISFEVVSGGTVNDDGTEVTGDAGEPIVWNFTVNAPSGFNTFRIEGLSETVEFTRNDLGLDAGETQANINGVETTFSTGGVATLTLTAVSEDNLVGTASVLVNINDSPDAEVRTAQILAAPLGNDESQTFYSVSEARTYSVDDVRDAGSTNVSQNIDFGYYYGASQNASLSSPSSYPTAVYDLSFWSTRNATAMVVSPITAEQYLGLSTVAEVEAALATVDFANAPTTLTNLTVGAIAAIRTAGGMEGFVQVTAINGTDGANDNIELELILAKSADD